MSSSAAEWGPKHLSAKLHLLNCGLISGLVQAGVLNPWDRALYLSIKENRHFLNVKNFKNPFSGLLQSLFQRAVSAGLYFPFEDIFRSCLAEHPFTTNLSSNWTAFLAGNSAGALNGLILNPLAAVKYHTWGIEECKREHFFSAARYMYLQGGLRPFVAGTFATVSRDMTFGGCFSLLRHALVNPEDSGQKKGVANMVAGFIATLTSSPMNYVRNMHYATAPSVQHLTARRILTELWRGAAREPTLVARCIYLQHKLRVGWGTARVACGMALGAQIYDICLSYKSAD